MRGGVAEWLKATVLKTVEPSGSRGSNPFTSAIPHPAGLTYSHPESPMKLLRSMLNILAATALIIIYTSCSGGGPPKPGQVITLKEHSVHLKLATGWTGEVVGSDWSQWRRVQRGSATDPWIIPPITVTNTGKGPSGVIDERTKNWRFKGVKGTFDPKVDPLTSSYPVPPGLWSLNGMKIELQESELKTLPWPNVSNVQATVRLYENTHGVGETASLWHTYTVTFNVQDNAYEFVMSIPDNAETKDWIDSFWVSIEDFSVS
jgi:hypothetical protein